ncbi:DUF523 domain-containing protein [Pseudoalteromonas denitrificans]|jgi:uncharacterized protein YbbK (DUF523 family)|uniref:Uncharacterized conserved protein YbbK, DUF523 family n=1 Tax=Pseudoalteromonas denitrificans DSM 6059 TaxID=1123010 RepID=A0A1I1RFD6_9GAMM|nr:DUF523 domain-containing protein [Pseudoalteromonas denitrificans]SFD29100.1 Uncharacterized conserved protein YbbK, DUF523 family [Pseudoalteromonas denitrificans DSM 6059]
MNKILVSSCLLGEPVRYDGSSKPLLHKLLTLWQQQGRIISFCPEVAGGLPIPRDAAEIVSDGSVLTVSGDDVTKEFELGAKKALSICTKNQIKFALLKEGSPSCGRNEIYDGSHQGVKVSGLGLTAKLLEENGIRVFSENQIESLYLKVI